MIYDMEAPNKKQSERLKHSYKNTEPQNRQGRFARAIPGAARSEEALAEGEDMAAVLAAELLIEEQRLSKRVDE
jgi:hypothetical protein